MEYNLEWLINDYGEFLKKFGLETTDVRHHYPAWCEQSGRDSVKDYLWYLFQVLLGETVKQVKAPLDLEKNKLEIYLAMWFFRTHVEGQVANDLQQLINDTRIRTWQLQLPYYFKVKIESGKCCPYCDSLDNQLFTPEALLQHHAFAVTRCTSDAGCQCAITPVAERDAANQIRLKDL